MSFILDALKKSETERQRQGGAEFAAVPVSPRAAAVPRWLWIVGLLLVINLGVLIGLLLRPDPTEVAAHAAPRRGERTGASHRRPAPQFRTKSGRRPSASAGAANRTARSGSCRNDPRSASGADFSGSLRGSGLGPLPVDRGSSRQRDPAAARPAPRYPRVQRCAQRSIRFHQHGETARRLTTRGRPGCRGNHARWRRAGARGPIFPVVARLVAP